MLSHPSPPSIKKGGLNITQFWHKKSFKNGEGRRGGEEGLKKSPLYDNFGAKYRRPRGTSILLNSQRWLSVRSFSKMQRETFEVEIFPIFSTSKKNIFFLQNCKNWNILQRQLFSEKSEIFPLFPLTRKFRKFIYPGL